MKIAKQSNAKYSPTFTLLLYLISAGLDAVWADEQAEPQDNCVSPNFSHHGTPNWHSVVLSLKNDCEHAIDLNGAKISWNDNQRIDNVWYTGNNNTSYPNILLSSNADRHSVVLAFDSGTRPTTRLNPKASVNLNYGGPLLAYVEQSVSIDLSGQPPADPAHKLKDKVFTEAKNGPDLAADTVAHLARINPEEASNFTTLEKPFIQRMIGYLPINWNNSGSHTGTLPSPEELAAAKYTHILIAFGIFSTDPNCAVDNSCILLSPSGNSDVYISSGDGKQTIDLKTYVTDLQRRGIKVLLSLGGASSNFGSVDFQRSFNLVQNGVRSFENTVDVLSQSIIQLMRDFKFDGIDIDVEAGLSAPKSRDLILAGSVTLCDDHFDVAVGLTPTSGSVCAMTAIIRRLVALDPSIMITLAPQTLNIAANRLIENQTLNYSALIANTRSHLNWVGVQVYNSGGMHGPNGQIQPITANNLENASVAMALNLLERWTAEIRFAFVSNEQAILRPDQVVLGYPATNGLWSDGTPSGNLDKVRQAVFCLNESRYCDDIAPQEKLPAPIGGVFNWNVNFDRANQYRFATTLSSQ